MQNCERIPTIGTQLKILSTVKATMFKGETDSQSKYKSFLVIALFSLNKKINKKLNLDSKLKSKGSQIDLGNL